MDWNPEIRHKIVRTNSEGIEEVGYVDAYTLLALTLVGNNPIPCENEPGFILEFNAYIFKTPAESILLGVEDEMYRSLQRRPPTMDSYNFDKQLAIHREEMWQSAEKVQFDSKDVAIFIEKRKELIAQQRSSFETAKKHLLESLGIPDAIS